MSDKCWDLSGLDYDGLEEMKKSLESITCKAVRPGVVNYHIVDSELKAIKAEMDRRNEPHLWKCECGRGFSLKDAMNGEGTLFGLTMRQIASFRTRWLRDGKKIEDL